MKRSLFRKYKRRYLGIVCMFLLAGNGLVAQAPSNESGITLSNKQGAQQLLIHEKPFLILGGELGNSSASDAEYMRPHWAQLKAMHLNTVLVPVYWELVEPEENKFDFSLVDSMIHAARRHELKIVILWFGTWKNSMSCYAPLWMKTNPKRFPRTADHQSRSQEIFSAFGKETLEADKKAFARLMKYVKETDADQKTVIMVQVENEIGMLPVAREVSTVANGFYNNKIPAELASYLQKNKNKLVPELKTKLEQQGFKTNENWETVFGKGIATDEIFQAWYYAKFTNEVTAAGKKEYNLPMFVNAALPRPNKLPGEYPSAGPLPHLMDIWQAGAPALDLLSPDFYNPDTKYWCDLYTRNGNPLFVPEMRFDETVAAKAFFIIGHYKALGFSPFSIETEKKPAVSLAKSYKVLEQLAPFIYDKNTLAMDGFLFDKSNPSTTVKTGNYTLKVSHDNTTGWTGEAKDSVWSHTGGIVLQTGADDFLVAGTGMVVTFTANDTNRVTNIASADEVSYEKDKEIKGRRMNGDQDHQGRHIRLPLGEWGIQKVKLYNSPARIE